MGDTNLQVELLGPPRVSVDGGDLDVDTRKALAVLALVAVDGDQSRESLATLLWPDSEPARARAALRRTLSVLRRGLGHRWLEAGRRWVTLDGPVDCDVTSTARLLDEVHGHDHGDGPCDACRARLSDLAATYRGRFLEGFVLRDSPGFDDWRAERDEYLRRRRCDALDLLGRLCLAAADLDGATAACRAWLEVDPLNERVFRRLMLLGAWRGERNEAIQHYRACVAVLDRELGVSPMSRTTDLYGVILEGRLPRHPARERDAAFRPPVATVAESEAQTGVMAVPELPLVGRDEQLSGLLDDHTDGTTDLLVVSGEAGVGKTRLLDEFVAHLHQRGTRVAMARCQPGEVDLAFGSVTELLRRAVGQSPLSRLDDIDPWRLAEAARLVPDLVGDRDLPSTASLSSPGAQARFFDAVWNVLELTVSIDSRGVLVLDDLHAIDAASLDLLGYGLRRLGDRDLTVVLCLRPEEVVDDDPVRRRLLDQPGIRDATREVVLERLTDEDVDRLVRAGLDRPDTSAIARQIAIESEGLPLLVVEYLRLVQDTDRSDAAGEDDGALDLGRLVPHGAAELARRRLGQVSETARQVASTAAVVGRSFDLSVVLRASGRTDDEVVAGLEELVARRIVRELPHEQPAPGHDVRYDFVHHKLRQAIHDRTSLARRRLLHRRIADALTAGTRGGRDAGAAAALVADHHLRGGQDRRAAAWFRRAGDHARSLFANREALGHYRRALALDDADGHQLQADVGEVCMLLGDYPEALAALELAAARADGDGPRAVVEHRLGMLHLRVGDLDAADAHLARAVPLAGTDDALLARIHADQALLAVRGADLDRADAAAGTALARAEDAADVAATAQARNVQGLVARHRGEHDAARDHFAASAAMAADLADARIAAMNNLALTEADRGDLDGAIERAREAVKLVARRGDRHREAALRNNLADLLHRAGRDDESMAALKEAVTIFAEVGQDPDDLRPEIWKLVEW